MKPKQYSSPLPPDSTVLYADYVESESELPTPNVVLHQDGSVLVSDSNLMGLLATLGFLPVSQTAPIQLGRRCWWAFLPEQEVLIRRVATSYYATYRRDPLTHAFTRRVMELRHQFACIARDIVKPRA